MKKIGFIAIACSIGLALQAQVIDSLNGDSLSEYTTTLVLDNSDGAGAGVSFSDTSGSLVASYTGTVSDPEQALFLAPATDFSTVFSVGDMLSVNVNTPASSTTEDFGLAIAATATPTAAGSGNSYNSRGTFDWTSISVRPSQSSIRVNTSISGTVTTGNNVANIGSTANISELFIDWVSADTFQLGYVSNDVAVVDATATFAPSSTIGAAIGFYGDLRATGTSLGSFSDLSIQPVPEPCTLALLALGSAGTLLIARRRK
ncbi:MAG TPA: PEP-CTERM sorting domain-containing protein [Alphaproteobacteria bacterium]|nr:PEP-CTERM sorting domain-containing protein [Alphaproteobacteria bacterium]